jgi:hypothetical protein
LQQKTALANLGVHKGCIKECVNFTGAHLSGLLGILHTGRAFFVRTLDFGFWFEVSGIALGRAIFVRRDACA